MSKLRERVSHVFPTTLSRPETGLMWFVASLVHLRIFEPVGLLVVVLESMTVQPLSMLVAVAGVVGGPVAVVGSVAGYLGYQSFQGGIAVWKSVEYLSLGLLVHLFWSRSAATDIRIPLRSVRQVWSFVTVVTLAAFGSASLFAWGYAATGQFRFFPLVVFSGVTQAISALVGGGVVLGVLPRLVGDSRWQSAIGVLRRRPRSSVTRSRPWIRLSLLICCSWVVAGSVLSVGFRTVALLPASQLRQRGLEALLLFATAGPFGQGAAVLQIGVGVTVFSLWTFSMHRYDILPQN